jgi:hypothetical protein
MSPLLCGLIRMHQATHVGDKWRGKSGIVNIQGPNLIPAHWIVGQLLDKLKQSDKKKIQS